MKILLIVWSLTQQMGGREKAGATLANAMQRRGHECIILTDDHQPRPPLYPLDQDVKLMYMDLFDNSYSREKIRKQIVKESPDVVMTMCSSRQIIAWPIILKGTGIPLIISERVDPAVTERDCWKNKKERLAVLSVADAIHVQMNGYMSYYPDFLKPRINVIPNPVNPADRLADPSGDGKSPKIIISVGRISEKQKRQRLLARSFALVADDFPDWHLHYWGGGAQTSGEELKDEIARMGLEGRAHVCWTTNNINEKLADAQIFAFPSEMEGCPNALLEAQAHGLPSFGYRCCGGTNEIIIDGQNGFLCDELTEESIAAALRKLLSDANLRTQMGQSAYENSKNYSPERGFALYEGMFAKAAKSKGSTRFDSPATIEEETEYREYIEHLSTRERVHKLKGPGCKPLALAMLEDLRKRCSRSYVRPIRDILRQARGKKVKK